MLKPFFIALQPWLPHHLISRIVGVVARSRIKPLKQWLINRVIGWYGISLDDYEIDDASKYESFNHFFTRALKPGARPLTQGTDTLACPVDGTISQIGRIDNHQIFQAKGKTFSTAAILGSEDDATLYQHGKFATIYLAPNNYHRIHMPLDGQLLSTRYVPGRLFSVNAASATHIDQVFARNERVVAQFETAAGKMALIMIGALNVGSIETVCHGVVAPSRAREITDIAIHANIQANIQANTNASNKAASPVTSDANCDGIGHTTNPRIGNFSKGQEFARFNLGSTVILLFEHQSIKWLENLQPAKAVQMGALIGQFIE